MSFMRLGLSLAGLAMAVAVALPGQEKSGPSITLKPVKYAGLADTVLQNRGKVIVVDLWQFG
jgi:hypothetical protein